MRNENATTELEELKRGIDIRDLAIQLGLFVRGRQARCYNAESHKHGDKNPSLGLNAKDNRYKCFTCGESGSVIDLYMAIRKVDLRQAINELREMYGQPTTPQVYKPTKRSKGLDSREVYNRLMGIAGKLDERHKKYLIDRGLTEETVARFKLFAIKDYRETSEILRREFNLETLQRAGLLGEKDNLIFYKHTLLVPFMAGNDVAFLQARRLDGEHPKYLMLRDVEVPLYNTDTLKKLSKGARVYVCEGVYDAIITEQEGLPAVAILGVNNFKEEWVSLFSGFEVVFALDNDEEGRRTTDKLAELFYLKGMKTKTLELPRGIKDVTDYCLSKKH